MGMIDLQAALDVREALSHLERDGFVRVPRVLSSSQVEALQARVDLLFASDRPKSKQVLYVDGQVPPDTPHLDALLHQWLNPHRFQPNLGTADLVDAPGAIAAKLLGSDPVLFQDLLLVKEPGQSKFPWHQDFPFWPIDRPQAVVCWIPLVESNPSGGGLQFLRGSHRLGPQPVVDLHRGGPQSASAVTLDLDAMFEAVCPALEPGDALFFSPLVFHSSAQRSTVGRRAAWSSIWLHPSVRWSHARAPAHPLCRSVEDGALVHSLASASGPPSGSA